MNVYYLNSREELIDWLKFFGQQDSARLSMMNKSELIKLRNKIENEMIDKQERQLERLG